MRKHPITFGIDPDDLEVVTRLADQERRTVAAMCRLLLVDGLNAYLSQNSESTS